MASRTVLRPPYAGARAIAEWAVELWPYLNGKALVSGLKLAEMDMTDMLDVLHYYMEEDFKVDSAEQAEARDKARAVLYKLIYQKEFKFGQSNLRPTASGFEEPIVPVDPTQEPTKSYIPPTDFNPDSIKPFGDKLDAPFEH